MSDSRKPDKVKRPPAHEVLDVFMKEKGIGFGLGRSQIDYTNTNTIVITPPKIIVGYLDEINASNPN